MGLAALRYAIVMRKPMSTSTARREFLKFLAASPYVAALGGLSAFLKQSALAQKTDQKDAAAADVIGTPAAALNVFDFEEAAHRKVRNSHWAYMVSGVDDDATLRANREGYQHVQLRPRRLRDATKVDMRVELFGTVYDSPIFLCPTSAHKAFWPDGEEAVARAAKARGTLQFLSSSTSTGVEDVNKALGRPVWYQFMRRTSGKRANSCCGAWKPPDARWWRSRSIILPGETVKPICVRGPRI